MLREINQFKEFFSHYTELRVQENRNQSLSFLNGSMVGNSSSANRGVSARVFKDGGWGFSSQPAVIDESVKDVIRAANNNAAFLGGKYQKEIILPNNFGNSFHDFSTSKNRFSQKEINEFLQEIDAYINKKYSDLNSRMVVMNNLEMEKRVITSDNGEFYSLTPRSIIYVQMSLMKDNTPISLGEVFGGLGQFEDNFSNPELLFAKIDETYNHLKNKTNGVFAKGGIHDVILDADLAGILAHEAIGHTTEADLVLGGSVAADYLNEKVASELITLVDFANTANDEICPVPVFTDDEGTKAEDAVIIENGILKSYMHNKESAEHFGVKPTGNARAYQFSDEPLIRMRNTAILAGKSKLEEMISSIEDGYYLIKSSNGQADSTSEFMFGVTLGYEIKDGKLGNAIKDTTISGIAFDMLKTVSMVSNDMSWGCAGMCGKKQMIPVGMGGPAIKCKINIGGK